MGNLEHSFSLLKGINKDFKTYSFIFIEFTNKP